MEWGRVQSGLRCRNGLLGSAGSYHEYMAIANIYISIQMKWGKSTRVRWAGTERMAGVVAVVAISVAVAGGILSSEIKHNLKCKFYVEWKCNGPWANGFVCVCVRGVNACWPLIFDDKCLKMVLSEAEQTPTMGRTSRPVSIHIIY